jgi:hypothetical protein
MYSMIMHICDYVLRGIDYVVHGSRCIYAYVLHDDFLRTLHIHSCEKIQSFMDVDAYMPTYSMMISFSAVDED